MEVKTFLEVSSTAFQSEGKIPSKYTCDGANVSPQISWSKVPEGTKSIALIADDPDAPMGTFVHWVIFNISPDTTQLPENLPRDMKLPDGAIQGVNSTGKVGYSGPCPPSGTHRYFFKIFALDEKLDLGPGTEKRQLEEAMNGHIIGQGIVMGRYNRQ